MIRILVVDDEPDLELLIKQKFRKDIRDRNFEFIFASNGIEALQILKKNDDIGVVVTDINMPEMDGLTLLVHLQKINPILKAIIVSAYGDMKNIRNAMNKGAFDFITKPINLDDLEKTIKKTIEYVEELKKAIKAIKENNILKMYVDESVIRFMSSKQVEKSIMASEEIEGAVIFSDIVGFTNIAEKLSPGEVINLLNKYFDIMVKSIIKFDGIVDKFIGDSTMAIFTGEDYLNRAILASLEIVENINKKDSDSINVSIGLNAGKMISGNTGSYSLKRLDFTVIGDVVNTASRYEDVANEGEIITGEDIYKKINNNYTVKFIGSFKLKNKTKPDNIYKIIT